LDGDSCAGEAGGAAEDVGVGGDDGHGDILGRGGGGGQWGIVWWGLFI
jgi:hypothetical protein